MQADIIHVEQKSYAYCKKMIHKYTIDILRKKAKIK